jgi:hypothetical protein
LSHATPEKSEYLIDVLFKVLTKNDKNDKLDHVSCDSKGKHVKILMDLLRFLFVQQRSMDCNLLREIIFKPKLIELEGNNLNFLKGTKEKVDFEAKFVGFWSGYVSRL